MYLEVYTCPFYANKLCYYHKCPGELVKYANVKYFSQLIFKYMKENIENPLKYLRNAVIKWRMVSELYLVFQRNFDTLTE